MNLARLKWKIRPAGSRFKPISLALCRRVMPSLFANKVVGVQPMAAPVGTAFAMRHVYNKKELFFKGKMSEWPIRVNGMRETSRFDKFFPGFDVWEFYPWEKIEVLRRHIELHDDVETETDGSLQHRDRELFKQLGDRIHYKAHTTHNSHIVFFKSKNDFDLVQGYAVVNDRKIHQSWITRVG